MGSTLLGRKTLAAMLSEALCSRARMVSERARAAKQGDVFGEISTSCDSDRGRSTERVINGDISPKVNPEDPVEDEVPFARRAREEGKTFCGGKCDGKYISLQRQVINTEMIPRHICSRRSYLSCLFCQSTIRFYTLKVGHWSPYGTLLLSYCIHFVLSVHILASYKFRAL